MEFRKMSLAELREYAKEKGIRNISTLKKADLPSKTDTVVVNRDVHFEQVAKVLNVSIEQLKQLNPQYRRNIVNGSSKPSALRLPAMLVNSFIDQEDSVYAYNADELLSKRTEVDVNDDAPAYSSRSSRSSYGKSSSKRSKSRSRRERRGRQRNVTIRQGDTLSEIAARNNTTVQKLRKLNKISGNNIRAGKKLRIK